MAVHAPRGDRAQVLLDLESQIADMLAREPAPLTEERVQSVIDKLEPASHFAATYGNGKQPPPESPAPAESPAFAALAARGGIRWSLVAMAFFALPFLGTFLEWLVHSTGGRASGAILVLSTVAGLVATPCALAMAYRQLRARPGGHPDRNLVVNMILGYAIAAPAFVVIVLTEWTYTLLFVPIGMAAAVYLHYLLVRRVRRYLIETLPPQTRDASPGETGQRDSAPPIGAAMPAAAV
jgi:hypothetical protein